MSDHTSLQDLFYLSGICGIVWLSYVKHRELKLLRLMAGLNTIQFGTQIVRRFSNWTNTLLPTVQRYIQDATNAATGGGNRRNYSANDLFNLQLLGNGTNGTIPPVAAPPATNARNLNSVSAQPQPSSQRPANSTVTTSNNGNIITATTTGEIELDNNQIMNLLLGFTGLGSGSSSSGLTNRSRNRSERSRGGDTSNNAAAAAAAAATTTSTSSSSNPTS